MPFPRHQEATRLCIKKNLRLWDSPILPPTQLSCNPCVLITGAIIHWVTQKPGRHPRLLPLLYPKHQFSYLVLLILLLNLSNPSFPLYSFTDLPVKLSCPWLCLELYHSWNTFLFSFYPLSDPDALRVETMSYSFHPNTQYSVCHAKEAQEILSMYRS